MQLNNAVDVFSIEHEEGRIVYRFMRGDVSEMDDSTFVHESYNVSPCLVPRTFRSSPPLHISKTGCRAKLEVPDIVHESLAK